MALNISRRGLLGPGETAEPDAIVVPVRRAAGGGIEIVREPQPDTSKVTTISLTDDGMVQLEIGGSDDDAAEAIDTGDSSEFNRNLAEDLDENALMALASWLIEGVEADIADRQEWEETANLGATYLGVKLTDPASTPSNDGTIYQGVSSVLLESQVKLWGTARAELLPVAGPVKVERLALPPAVESADPSQEAVTGDDKQRDDLADALERDMNWYLTKGDKGYYPDTSRMLFHRSIIGNGFKEVYRCPIERKPVSRWVMAQDLIVSGNPTHLEAAKRVTKRAKVDQGTMKRLQASGHYREVTLAQATGQTSQTELVIGETQGVVATPTLPRDFDHTLYETCCTLGSGTNHSLVGSLALLDRDENGVDPGYPLPYHVSIDLDSRTVLAVYRDWKQGNEDHRRRRRFVKYGFIPGFGFYDLGLIHLVGNPTQGATMIQRAMVDSGMFANFPAWAALKGAVARTEQSVFRPMPGEVVTFPATGAAKIGDQIMPWPYKPPSAEAMAMGAKLEGDVRKVAGNIDIPVGEGRIGNTPVGTIMSYIESISQVPGAVHKDDHIAQAEEFELLRELLAEEPQLLWRGNKSPARKWQTAEELMSPDLMPAADPNTPSQIHRLTKIQGLVALGGQPQFAMDKDGPIANNRAIFRRAAEVLSGGDADEFMFPANPQIPAPPPPDPRVLAAQINAGSHAAQSQAQLQGKEIDAQSRTAEAAVDAQQREADRQSEETRAAMTLAGKRTEAEAGSAHQNADRVAEATQKGMDRTHEATQNALDRTSAAQTAALSGPLSGTGETPAGGGT